MVYINRSKILRKAHHFSDGFIKLVDRFLKGKYCKKTPRARERHVMDVISIGSATQDTFLFMKKISVYHSSQSITGERICFPHGSKIEVDSMYQDTGGGGTNAAVGFARLGLHAGYVGKIGADITGRAILHELRSEGIHVEHVIVERRKGTGHSIILSGGEGERTVFVYRGSNNDLTSREIPYHYIKESRWVYLAPLSGKSGEIIGPVIDYCYKNHIMVAWNPSGAFLSAGIKKLAKILEHTQILITNLEEASILTGISTHQPNHIIHEIRKHFRGILIITNGHEELIVTDSQHYYRATPLKVHIVNTLGAGDAFASGFVSSFIQHKPVDECIRTGSLNASSVVQYLGAKRELLRTAEVSKRRHLARRIRIISGPLSSLHL
jgi:ribokinase